MKKRSLYTSIFVFFLFVFSVYGVGRFYFYVTDGFTISNISSDWPYDSRWETRELNEEEKPSIIAALEQEYKYLGKGCQSYVFASEDGQYVLKFFKYQRFRSQPWLKMLSFIPPVNSYAEAKAKEKKTRLDALFWSWKAAFMIFPEQTGVVYVHLNKTPALKKRLILRDKLGIKHTLNLDDMEFMIQRRATMLCPAIENLMAVGEIEKAKDIIARLIAMVSEEYFQGYADNDHALMQNTGVLDERPIHIDVGQLIHNDTVKEPRIYKKELHCKTFFFVEWLKKNYPMLAEYAISTLEKIIGPELHTMAPYVYKGGVAKIPNQELMELPFDYPIVSSKKMTAQHP